MEDNWLFVEVKPQPSLPEPKVNPYPWEQPLEVSELNVERFDHIGGVDAMVEAAATIDEASAQLAVTKQMAILYTLLCEKYYKTLIYAFLACGRFQRTGGRFQRTGGRFQRTCSRFQRTCVDSESLTLKKPTGDAKTISPTDADVALLSAFRIYDAFTIAGYTKKAARVLEFALRAEISIGGGRLRAAIIRREIKPRLDWSRICGPTTNTWFAQSWSADEMAGIGIRRMPLSGEIAAERLDAFIGGYLRVIDFRQSTIVGPAVIVALHVSDIEQKVFSGNFRKYTDAFFSPVLYRAEDPIAHAAFVKALAGNTLLAQSWLKHLRHCAEHSPSNVPFLLTISAHRGSSALAYEKTIYYTVIEIAVESEDEYAAQVREHFRAIAAVVRNIKLTNVSGGPDWLIDSVCPVSTPNFRPIAFRRRGDPSIKTGSCPARDIAWAPLVSYGSDGFKASPHILASIDEGVWAGDPKLRSGFSDPSETKSPAILGRSFNPFSLAAECDLCAL